MYYNGVDVDLNSLQPGDILCFGSSIYNIWHVGLYIGDGQFIHSPSSGQVVSIGEAGWQLRPAAGGRPPDRVTFPAFSGMSPAGSGRPSKVAPS